MGYLRITIRKRSLIPSSPKARHSNLCLDQMSTAAQDQHNADARPEEPGLGGIVGPRHLKVRIRQHIPGLELSLHRSFLTIADACRQVLRQAAQAQGYPLKGVMRHLLGYAGFRGET